MPSCATLARQVVKSQEGRARPPLARAARQHQPDAGVDCCCSNPPWTQLGREAAPAARCSARCSASATRCTRCGASRNRLRPAELDTLGLPAALDDSAAEFDQHGRASRCSCGARAPTLPDEVNTVLFRVVQESLTNIEKHAASRVQIRLIFHAGGLRLRIVDDGIGFDVPAIRVDPRRGIGMRNMRERVESIGGSFTIASRPGRTRCWRICRSAPSSGCAGCAGGGVMTASTRIPAGRRPPAGARRVAARGSHQTPGLGSSARPATPSGLRREHAAPRSGADGRRHEAGQRHRADRSRLRAQYPELRVLMLSMYDNPEHVHRALAAGAMGYVLKEAPAERSSTPSSPSPPGAASSAPGWPRAAPAPTARAPAAVAARGRDPARPGARAGEPADRRGAGHERAPSRRTARTSAASSTWAARPSSSSTPWRALQRSGRVNHVAETSPGAGRALRSQFAALPKAPLEDRFP